MVKQSLFLLPGRDGLFTSKYTMNEVMRLAHDIGCPMYHQITNGKHGEAADMLKNADIY